MIFEPILQRDGVTYSIKLTLNHHNFNVLIDCGWDAALSLDLEPVEQALQTVDLVLLTHASISHLGAFAYLWKTCQRLQKVPVYCTYPVMAMGKLISIDAYRSTGLSGPFVSPALSVEDIEQCYNSVNLIKYSQAINLGRHKLEGVQITGYNSGHTLGGTLWKIETPSDSLIAALDWNHSKDTHLNGGFLETGGKVSQQLIKPQVLITSSNVCKGSLKKNKTQFGDLIKQTMASGGSVLVPTSLSRVLELVLILDQLDLKVPILFCSAVAKRVMTQASSMLEWMITSIINDWQVKNESPFNTSRVKCVTFEALENYKDESKIVLCTDEALGGVARRIFSEFAAVSRNMLLLTQTAPTTSLAASLLSLKKGSSLAGDVPLKVFEEVPLQGAALRKYKAQKQEEREQAEAAEQLDKRNEAILAAPMVSDDESEEEMEDEEFPRGVFDYTVTPGLAFPNLASRTKTDDYGELIKPGQFRLEENVEMEVEIEKAAAAAPVAAPKKKFDEEPPMALNTVEKIVKLACRLEFVDLNGLTDTRSLAMILGQVAPLSLVVLPGDAAAAAQKDLGALVGDVRIELQNENKTLNLQLSPTLPLHWQQVLGQSRVAHVTGRIEDGETGQLQLLGSLEGSIKSENSFYVGEIKLTELKKKLSAAGYRAEFQNAGVLVCNNKVSVSKQGDGFLIEGGLDDEFYVVRKAVKSFLAQI